jgi:choline dehydrogenase-like flavoprotein
LYCIGNPRTDWCYKTKADPGLNGRQLGYPRGRVLGGCSSINGMIYMRGQRADYDGWAALGNTGWGWDDLLPLYKGMENHHGGYILHEGTIFGFSRAFRGVWMAQDLKTGDVLWSKKVGSGKSGSIGFADGMLYCYDDGDGICYLAKPSKTGWEPAGQVKLPEITAMDRKKGAIWAHPVIADQKLFIRDQEKLFAFDIRQ